MKLRACLFAGSALLSAALLGSIGCVTPQQPRAQVADELPEGERYELKCIADVTDTVSNADAFPVAGVGLVTGLAGTGSATRPSGWRSRLERELQRKQVRNIKELLEDKNNSLVLVTGMIPAGAHKGDAFDVEVTLPPGSDTKSLNGGYLQECVLVDYELIASLGPASGTDRVGQGLPRAKAAGRVLVELGEKSEGAAKKGRIWSGGRSLVERTFVLSMNEKNLSARVVAQVAERLNETFHGPLGAAGNSNMSTPGADRVSVTIGVPPQYKLNLPRYLRVVRLVPLREKKKLDKDNTANTQAALAEMLAHYKQQLDLDLLDPARTVTAALRLEALGADSIPALKRGLKSDHVLVRFCAAEALAYLDCTSGAQELRDIIATQPCLRAYALTALASLDEGVSISNLQELLSNADPEVRYGSFRALRALDEKTHEGEMFGQGFCLHHVAPGSLPLVHVSTSRRAEIVLFGDDADLTPGFSLLAGNFVIASATGDSRCTVSHRVAGERDYRQCSLKLEDVLRTMARMNATYNEVLEFLAQAYKIKSLSCDLRFDALPQAPSVQELSKAGVDAKRRAELARQGKVPEAQDRTDEELFNARTQLGGTPGLFEKNVFGRKYTAELMKDHEASLDSPEKHR